MGLEAPRTVPASVPSRRRSSYSAVGLTEKKWGGSGREKATSVPTSFTSMGGNADWYHQTGVPK